MLDFILLALFAYLLGSIPFGFIIPKMKGVDIRTIGSKATSTTNVSRALGWRWAILSGALDVIKGIIPAYLALSYLTNEWEIILVCLLPAVGHVFPVWLNFKGGKGAAPFFGATAMLIGIKIFLTFFIIWILILLVIRIMSLTNIVFPWILSALFYALHYPAPYFVYAILAGLVIAVAMRENIKRLIDGTEPRVVFKW
jgi:acyl phosphate:glycerol-3-phosphate acyltransferase